MKLRGWLALAIPLAAVCLAAPQEPKEPEEPKRPKEILGLLDQARGLPPEFSADILIKLAASRHIPDTKWKKELLEEAFLTGAHAQLPYQRTFWGGAVDGRWNQEYAHNDLEALTLQTRAVEAMLPLDSQRAAAMFQDIAFPELVREKCEEPAVAIVEGYYDIATKVFAAGFTPRQRQKEEDLQLLAQLIGRMQSPAQVPRVLRLIYAVKVGDETRHRLLTTFAVTLDRVNGGDRAYGAYESQVVPAFGPTVDGATMLLNSIRGYIVRQVSGARCSDHIAAGKLPASVSSFNSLAAKVDPAASWLKPIGADESKPAKDDGTYPPQKPWASKRAWDVLMALKWLDHGDTDPVAHFTAEQRKSPEWIDHFNDLMKLIEGWKEEEEASPEEYLINVALTYGLAAAGAPPGPQKETVMGRYLNFLETRYAGTANRNLWFAQVQALLRTAHLTKEESERQWILERLERSANPIIALYAKVETMLGPAG